MATEEEREPSLAPQGDGAFAHRHTRPRPPRGLRLRNALNILFMVMAIAGVIIYLKVDSQRGIIVVLVAMGVKLVESAIRIQNKLTENQ